MYFNWLVLSDERPKLESVRWVAGDHGGVFIASAQALLPPVVIKQLILQSQRGAHREAIGNISLLSNESKH